MSCVHTQRRDLRPILWGAVIGAIQAASPVAVQWLEPANLHGLYIAFIAAVYVGFAVADGRAKVIAVESAVAGAFFALAVVGVNSSAWLLVAAYGAHGAKDLWQHRTHYVTGTRWWPPFCATIDALVAVIIAAEIIAGVSFHG